MSNPYGPPLETIQDWNASLGCCCGIPTAPAPLVDLEWLVVYGVFGGYADGTWEETDPRYGEKTISYLGSDPFVETFSYDSIVGVTIQGVAVGDPAFHLTVTDNEGTTFETPTTETFALPVTLAAARSGIESTTATELDWASSDYTPNRFNGYDLSNTFWATREETISAGLQVTMLYWRYRWRVPSEHAGNHYKITWDVVYRPDGWDNESIPVEDRPLRYSKKNLTVVWTGPGTGTPEDDSWIAGDWFALDAPDEPGVVEVINVRFEHMTGGPA